ncbi:F-box domain-containing protein [Dioscorea alata]|uniref:F-box domain-containing protein n=1 Tax=Dioscorea alata TaxID=55571 RepID=A0ACB7V049_DIOAL|nr:F-box domain-containing protein [Dioscorea alata]
MIITRVWALIGIGFLSYIDIYRLCYVLLSHYRSNCFHACYIIPQYIFFFLNKDSKTLALFIAVKHMDNEDVYWEILSWLPIQSLMRFKSVCKLWQDIISHPFFITIHYQHHCNQQETPGFIFQYLGYAKEYHRHSKEYFSYFYSIKHDKLISLPDPSLSVIKRHVPRILNVEDMKVSALCSWDGLVLYRVKVYTDGFKFLFHYLCNPFTLALKEIPCPDKEFDRSSIKKMFLIPDHRVISVEHVKTGEFQHKYLIKMYSMETNKWSICGTAFTRKYKLSYFQGCFWNQAVNWISHSSSNYGIIKVVVSFNIESYDMHQIIIPDMPTAEKLWRFHRDMPTAAKRWRFHHIGESRGHLYFVRCEKYYFVLEIFEADKDYSGWSILYHVDLRVNHVLKSIHPSADCTFLWLSGVTKENDKLLICTGRKEFICNLANQTVYEATSRLEGSRRQKLHQFFILLPVNCTLISP